MRFSIPHILFLCILCAPHARCAPAEETTNENFSTTGESTVISSLGHLVTFKRDNLGVDFDVDLNATVNYWDQEWHSLYVQDGEHGLFIHMPTSNYSNGFEVESGVRVRIVGRFFAAKGIVFADQVDIVRQDLPVKAENVSMLDVGPGAYWSVRVRIQGVVESALIHTHRTQLVLHDGDKRLIARLKRSLTPQQIEHIVGAEVSLVGTLSYLVDSVGDPTTCLCLCMPTDDFVITKPGDFDYSDVKQFEAISDIDLNALPSGPFAFSGQLGHIRKYDFWILENDETEPLSIYAPFEGDIHVSEIIRVIAVRKRPGVLSSLPLIAKSEDSLGREADMVAKLVFWKNGSFLPPPTKYRASEVIQQKLHRRRCAVTGNLVSVSSKGFDRRLLLEDNHVSFECRFSASPEQFKSLNLARAHSVTLAGLVEQTAETPSSGPRFSIELSSPSKDITVESERPQVDGRFALGVVLGMSGLIVGGLLVLLRLRNRYGDQRKNLENVLARLNSSYDAVHEALLVIDHREGVVGANSKVMSVLGLSGDSLSVESLERVGVRIANCLSEREEFLSAWNEIQTDPYVTLEFEFETVDVPRRSLGVYTAPVVNRDGEADGRIWSFDDVSHRKQLEANLIQSQKMEAVGRLAGGIAHDFNNLLLAMMANIDLARMQPETKDSTADEYLAVADEAADRAAKLVKHLMGFSRKTQLEMEVGQPNLVVAEVERLLMRTFDSRILLAFELAPDLWNARIDVNQLEQVLLNICLNARDALRGDNDTITIATKNVEASLSPLAVASVCIRVSDNGVGMTDFIREKVFDPFFTTKESGKGTGLGLSMSFGIIEQHGGTIRCSSELGTGTHFDVYLPRSLDRLEPSESIENDLSALGKSSGRVLIADDESITSDSVANALRFHGFQVDTVANGLEALKHLRSTVRTDLVLLDLSMPVMSGAAALQRIQYEFPSVQVIIYSGYMQELEELQNENGQPPYAIISKPFKVADIVKLVGEAIGDKSDSGKTDESSRENSSVRSF